MAKKSKKTKDYISMDENRFGLFMTEGSFDLEMMYGREYVKTDVNFSIKLYRVNVLESEVDELYGEASPSEKKFFSPIMIKGIVDIDPSSQAYMPGSMITREDTGSLKFKVFMQELDELNVDISRGDFIGFNMSGEKERYYEVSAADNISDSTNKTIIGMKPFWKLIVAIPVKGDVVPFV